VARCLERSETYQKERKLLKLEEQRAALEGKLDGKRARRHLVIESEEENANEIVAEESGEQFVFVSDEEDERNDEGEGEREISVWNTRKRTNI
jgi:myo-inositol-1-phosphate synthase